MKIMSRGEHVREKRAARKRKYETKIGENEKDEETSTMESVAAKQMKITFDSANFISRLKKDDVVLSEVLGNFCACATELSCGKGDIDAVHEYLQHSPQCIEITELFNSDKRPTSELQLIFNCLTSIILRLADDLLHFRTFFLPSLHVILRMHMRHVYRSLNPKNNTKIIMAALRFLTAVVALSTSSAHEVLNVFKFDHVSLTPLFQRRNSKADEDVRTCLMRFAIAFLVSGDQHTITQFLANKEFLKGFFKGLVDDKASTLDMFLKALLEHVVRNPAISKTQKLPVFNEFTLFQFAHLYNRWKGHYDIEDQEIEEAEDPEYAGREAFRKLVHSFLLEVTTSTKHGINFYDKSLGLAGKNLNGSLLKFLQMLKTATTDDLVNDLVIRILKTCPDLLHKYLSSCPFSFTPRASASWLANMELIHKIFKFQSDVSPAFKTDKVGISKLVSMVMVTTVPVICDHAFLLQCIKHQSPIVCLTGLEVIERVMHRAQSNMKHSVQADALSSAAEKQSFSAQYQDALLKVLPDVDTLLSCWDRYLVRMREGSKQPTEVTTSSHLGDQRKASGLNDPEPAEILITIMRILTAYTTTLPSALIHTSYDFSRLLHGIFHSDHMTIKEGSTTAGASTHHALQLQYETMILLMGIDVGRFRWFKEVKGEGSAMRQLLDVLMTSTDPKLTQVSKQLISKVLKHTGQFDQCPDEPVIWLDSVCTVTSVTHNPKAVTCFLQRILSKVVRNPYPLNDVIMEAGADVEMGMEAERERMEVDDGDTRSMSDAGIAAVLEMDEITISAANQNCDIIESDHLQQEKMTSDIGQLLPCSALVPAALEEFNMMNDKEKVADYISQVLTTIINTQHNPGIICKLVQQASQNQTEPLPSSWNHLLSYCNVWLPPSRQIKVSKVIWQSSLSSLTVMLQGSFMKRLKPDKNMKQDIMKKVPDLRFVEILPIMQQCLLYIGSCHQFERDTHTALFYTELFMSLLHHAKDISTLPEDETKERQHATNDSNVQIDQKYTGNMKEHDWLKLSHEILRHPLICELKFDECSQRIGEIVDVMSLFVPRYELEKELHHIVTAAENSLRRLLAPSIDLDSCIEDKRTIITNLLMSLKVFILPDRCLQILRDVLTFLKMESAKKQRINSTGCHFSSSLLSLLVEYMKITSITEISLSRDGRMNSHRTPPAAHVMSYPELNCLNTADVEDILTIATDAKSWKLFSALGHLLQAYPDLVSKDLNVMGALNVFLEASAEQRNQMGKDILPILVQSNHCQFEEWIIGISKKKSNIGNLCDLHAAIAAYLSISEETKKKGVQCRKHLHKLLWKPLVDELTAEGSGQIDVEGSLTDIVSSSRVLCLLLPYVTQQEVKALLEVIVDLPLSHNRALTKCQLEVLKGATEIVLKQEQESNDSLQGKILTAVLQSLVLVFKTSAEHHVKLQDVIVPIRAIIEHLQDFPSDRDIAVTWKQFVISGLKGHYENHAFLDLLTRLIQLVYSASHLGRKFMPLRKLYHAVVGHSKFLPIMLGSGQEATPTLPDVKGALVSLLVGVSQREPSCCNTVHFTVLLGAYNATRTLCDRELLSLMHIYEKNNAHMWEYRPYMWGKEAVSQHSAKKALGSTLWKQPSVEDVLKLLDTKLLYQSMLKFPLDQKLHPDTTQGNSRQYEMHSELYDPSFLLPLFSYLLLPENVVPCQTFVETNALGFVLASLSSNHDDVRRAGYHILSCFIQHLEGARFRGRREIAFILEMVRNSVSSPAQYIAPLMTVFLERAIDQMLQPESSLYPILISYLMYKPQLNLNKVPLFPRLFIGAQLQHKTEKTWFLSFLNDGLRSPADMELLSKSNVFQTLLAFHASPLCDKAIGDLIMRVVLRACELTEGALYLGKHHSILVWIQAQKKASAADSMDKLVHALEKSLLSKDNKTDEMQEALDRIKFIKSL